jgi:hypothetical protein
MRPATNFGGPDLDGRVFLAAAAHSGRADAQDVAQVLFGLGLADLFGDSLPGNVGRVAPVPALLQEAEVAIPPDHVAEHVLKERPLGGVGLVLEGLVGHIRDVG